MEGSHNQYIVDMHVQHTWYLHETTNPVHGIPNMGTSSKIYENNVVLPDI